MMSPCNRTVPACFSLLILFCLSYSPSSFASREWPLQLIDASSIKIPARTNQIIIAVIDTGIDTDNPELKSILWQNPGESGKDSTGADKSTNGKDDDQNGFVDDIHGWNFAQSSPKLQDVHGHGTHVAGIIASVTSGRFPPVTNSTPLKIMVLKYFEDAASPYATMNNTIQAINYAIRNGAHIINYSGGGLNPNAQEKAALQKASEAGILVVAAAGNEAANSDVVGYYPANYNLPNILSVGAVNAKKQMIESSNFGLQNVDLAAPGEDVPSTLPAKTYGLMTGTSQATAFASAVAGLVLASRTSKISPEALISHLTATGAVTPQLKTKVKSGSVLNAKRSVQMGFETEFANLSFVENYRTRTETFISELNDENRYSSRDNNQWSQALLSELATSLPAGRGLNIR